MAIYKISDHPDLDLVGKFVCGTSVEYPVRPARVSAIDGDVVFYSPLMGCDYDRVTGNNAGLVTVSEAVGRRTRFWTDLACDTVEEVVAVWRRIVANRQAIEDLARTSRQDLIRAALAGELCHVPEVAAGPARGLA